MGKYYRTRIGTIINVNIDKANKMKKSAWKKRCIKEQIKAKAEERMKIKVKEGTKLVNDRFERKQYIYTVYERSSRPHDSKDYEDQAKHAR